MADWLGKRLFGKPMQVSSNAALLPLDAVVLNYSDAALPQLSYRISPHALLFEKGIHEQHPFVFSWHGKPAFFATENGDHAFDLLAASFFLISRYEEYLPHTQDEYGRYAHTNSIAFRNGFLKRPLVDEWIEDLKESLVERFPSQVFLPNIPTYLPTCDVDVAWCYRNKGWLRNAGGFFKDLLAARWRQSLERWLVLAGLKSDPFSIFIELEEHHQLYGLKARYFFLLAKEIKGYDKNIPRNSHMLQRLMRWVHEESPTGIHFSWAAANNETLMKEEWHFMQQVIHEAVVANRMHYINFHLPKTFRQLMAAGITEDYSMGYGSINGFRASTSHPFFWYDLQSESTTGLLLYPFAWMEANSIFEQKDSPDAAAIELQEMYDVVMRTGGTFITICHNHLMGLDAEGRKWWRVYTDFLRKNFVPADMVEG